MSDVPNVLLKLVQGRDGVEWQRNRIGWKVLDDGHSTNACEWEGITCDGTFVTEIKLPRTDLSATIPYEFGELSMLKVLDLGYNSIHGEIPQPIFDLPHLEKIDLANNDVTGSIKCFASSVFSSLKLDSNFLYGTLPTNCRKGYNQNMVYFSVIRNKIQGTIPEFFALMQNLNTLSLSENRFSGTIPNKLGEIKSLSYLYLDNNYLQGTVPPSLGSGTSLLEIWLQENLLSGTIPAHIADLPGLFNFYVDGNKLTGTVPMELCSKQINEDFFKGIEEQDDRDWCQSVACPVGNVALQGVYPCKECQRSFFNPYLGRINECIDLEEVDIVWKLFDSMGGENWVDMDFPWDPNDDYYCGFTGITCDNKKNIIGIDLSSKGLKGTIPEELGFLQYLRDLDLSQNYLTGYLPSDLRFSPLETLDISGNQLKGIVPLMLCNRPINGNGDGGNYDCNYIACPQGYFSPIGRMNSKKHNKCFRCEDTDNVFLGKNFCQVISNTVISTSSSSTEVGVSVFFICFVFVTFSVLYFRVYGYEAIRKLRKPNPVTKEETIAISNEIEMELT